MGVVPSYADTYSWKDDKGVMIFTNDPALIPPKFRVNAHKGEDITIHNPKVQQELQEQEDKAREDVKNRANVERTLDYVPRQSVSPAIPILTEEPAPRTKSQRIRDNIERREKGPTN